MWSNRVEGWDDYVIKQRFGVVNTQVVRQIKRPVEEMLAQMSIREFFGIELGDLRSELNPADSRSGNHAAGGGGADFSPVSTRDRRGQVIQDGRRFKGEGFNRSKVLEPEGAAEAPPPLD